MGFSAKQLRALRQSLHERNLRTRSENGRELSYIEGWHAIGEANRIFGFDGWDRETVESRCVMAREIRGSFSAVYVAKVRITVRAGGETIVREGHGSGQARGATAGEVHDMAYKTAETDATKRALATFGKPFGLALYLGGNRAEPPVARPSHSSDRITTGNLGRGEQAPSSHPRTDAPGIEHRTAVGNYPGSRAQSDKSLPATEPPPLSRGAADRVSAKAPGPMIAPPVEESIPSLDSNPAKIDKAALMLSEPRRYRDKFHLGFVASQPCLLCGRRPSDPHHLRFAQPRALGRKVSDEFTVPLCRVHHRQVHQTGNEAAWWEDMDVDPIPIANGLWEEGRAKRGLRMSDPEVASKATESRDRKSEEGRPAETSTSPVGRK
jgi:hypothetical protein